MKKINQTFQGPNGTYSSKRVIGTLMVLVSIVFASISMIIEPIGVIDESVLVFIGSMVTGGIGLIGSGIIENIKNKRNINNEEE